MTTSSEKRGPLLVVTGLRRTTVLSGKKLIREAAQYGSQRFRPKVVVPLAWLAVQLVQCVAVSSELASAQEMIKVFGAMTAAPLQLRRPVCPVTTALGPGLAECGLTPVLLGDPLKAPKPPAMPTPTTTRATIAPLPHAIRRRRARNFASRNRATASSGRTLEGGATPPGLVEVITVAIIIGVMASVKHAPPADREAALELPRLDRRDPTLLHEQVAAELRRAIADGEAGPGERIPPARDLAAELGVNTNTVLRALRVLRDEGLLEVGRGRSIRVTGTASRGAVVTRVRELVDFAREQGYRKDELVAILKALP